MESLDAIAVLAALAQETRLEVFRSLVRAEPDGVAAGDLARALNVPANTMSTHLAVLTRAGLVSSRRDRRSIIYRADMSKLRALTLFLAADCCGGNADLCAPLVADLIPCCAEERRGFVPDRIYNVMFLCTGNSARSIMAEAILQRDGNGHFRAFSAGSYPNGKVNPFALKVLESYGYPALGARSKSWDEFSGPDAPVMDFVFTVCDNAAGEVCPIWPGHPMTAHWGIDDPAAIQGPDIEKERAFVQAFKYLRTRIGVFLSLPLASIDKMALGNRLREIGKLDGASTRLTGAAE
ncbi:MAG: ArsR family transcriptional regulator [Acidocella sp. 20-57-95]|nr:MAG: ArsR family transcriptional regulator [Acidocella sp. 20-57-95]OYV58657.1 MAG: ArsR family transcriptional regulator [Acidocella sp. 21-58-7]HQT65152.1 metalloregulator ArsR/SmtB family transcription factor [Acidocella sp.]HQU03566.1 metalloregulator ArsR/SmtB family transcription factor [Acidocella sp.]